MFLLIVSLIKVIVWSSLNIELLDTERKLNKHKTFRGSPGRLLNVFCTFNLCAIARGKYIFYPEGFLDGAVGIEY